MGEYYGQYGEGLAFYPGERSTPNMSRVYYETIKTIGVALQQYAIGSKDVHRFVTQSCDHKLN